VSKQRAEIKNELVILSIENNNDDVQVCLVDPQSMTVWADSPWSFQLEAEIDGINEVYDHYRLRHIAQKETTIEWTANPFRDGHIQKKVEIRYSITLQTDQSYFEDQVQLHVIPDTNMKLKQFRCQWALINTDIQFMPIPFASAHQKPGLHDMNDFQEHRLFEGLLLRQGSSGLCMAKRPSDREPQWIGIGRDELRIRFGGVSQGVPLDMEAISVPESGIWDYGLTSYHLFQGSVETGLQLYRNYMVRHGIRLPEHYDPPINYCIYYECGDYYHNQNLLKSMDYAFELGCTLLYTDQGWETYFGSGLWDEIRFGEMEKFIALAASRGLDIGVLVGMHALAYNWPNEMTRKNQDGTVALGDPYGHFIGICPTSEKWNELKTERLSRVAQAGVKFFSFDFNDCYKPCYDESHPHSQPLREWEHVKAVADQQAAIKQRNPQVLIEAHDWKNAGSYQYPIYMFNEGHDERWGFEYMWQPVEDFKSGRMHNLYYYNLAYEKPLYLHIDLTSDFEDPVVFWYVASTIRHIGVGNYSALSEERRRLYRSAISIYKENRSFFSNGIFSGEGPLIHCHTLPDQGSVILFFHDQEIESDSCLMRSKAELGLRNGNCRFELLFGSGDEDFHVKDSGESLVIRQKLKGYSLAVIKVTNAEG
jgi:hypothetical protein